MLPGRLRRLARLRAEQMPLLSWTSTNPSFGDGYGVAQKSRLLHLEAKKKRNKKQRYWGVFA